MSVPVRNYPIAPTSEEMQAIKNYAILPLVLSVFDRDKTKIETLKAHLFKTSGPYIDRIELSMDRITQDISKIKKELQKANIKMFEMQRDKDGFRIEYKCRGYIGTFSMLWNTVGGDVESLMRYYLGTYRDALLGVDAL